MLHLLAPGVRKEGAGVGRASMLEAPLLEPVSSPGGQQHQLIYIVTLCLLLCTAAGLWTFIVVGGFRVPMLATYASTNCCRPLGELLWHCAFMKLAFCCSTAMVLYVHHDHLTTAGQTS